MSLGSSTSLSSFLPCPDGICSSSWLMSLRPRHHSRLIAAEMPPCSSTPSHADVRQEGACFEPLHPHPAADSLSPCPCCSDAFSQTRWLRWFLAKRSKAGSSSAMGAVPRAQELSRWNKEQKGKSQCSVCRPSPAMETASLGPEVLESRERRREGQRGRQRHGVIFP